MRSIALGDGAKLKVSEERRAKLKQWLQDEHTKAINSRWGVEQVMRESIRAYQGASPEGRRWVPFENAPVVEVTIGAMACDAVYAQAVDLITQVSPPLTLRSRKEKFDAAADALQERVNVAIESENWNYTNSMKAGLLDNIQLGTMVFYVPWTKTVRKTDVREVSTFGPKIYALAPEDFILPANATKDIESAKFATMRMYMGRQDLNLRARLNNWTVDDAASPDSSSNVRKDRMRAAGLSGGGYGDNKPTICIGDTFCYFDIDGDGIDEDLEVIWNMTSGNPLKVMYNRYDTRPFVLENYQDRAHSWAGVSAMEMAMPFERAITEIWNNHIWNMMIANTKMYQVPETMIGESEQIYPGRIWPWDGQGEGIKEIAMGQPNASAVQAVQMMMAMVRERIGTQLLTAPVSAKSRTPGISMLSMMQQANRRFTPQFDNMRNGLSNAVMQCLYREQERVRSGDKEVIQKLHDLMGDDKAELIIGLYKASDVELTDALDIQLTAASVSVNREADRQNMVMLATQIWPLYYGVTKELAQYKAAPPFPGAEKLAQKADDVINKLMGKILKTFDQISDVRTMIIDLEDIQPVMDQLGLSGANQAMMGQMNGAAPMGAPPGVPMQ